MSVTVNVRGVKSSFKQADEDLNEILNSLQRINANRALEDLVFATPVDTGRARASWYLSKYPSNVSEARTLLGPIPRDKIETLFINNLVPYIRNLNQGSSSQAPARFIEKTVSKYFTIKSGDVSFG